MSARSRIEWTDATWNPIRGCSRVSPGCENCYAERQAMRFSGEGQPWHGLVRRVNGHPTWTGKTRLIESMLDEPSRWRRPRRVFVCSMSDLFHESVPDEWIDRVFAVMALCPQHTFQVLTKRAARMRDYCSSSATLGRVTALVAEVCEGTSGADFKLQHHDDGLNGIRLENVWLGVSVENQEAADERVPRLLETPAAVRFLSCEPLLGAVDLTRICDRSKPRALWINCIEPKEASPAHSELIAMLGPDYPYARIDWIIAGGESGPGARPMHPEWARSLRNQCVGTEVPFFFKQWGEWAPHRAQPGGDEGGDVRRGRVRYLQGDGREPDGHFRKGDAAVAHVGKRAAGRVLDGHEYSHFPRVRA